MHIFVLVAFGLAPSTQIRRSEFISVGLLEPPWTEERAKPNLTPPPLPKPKTQKITPPKLISKPELMETPPLAPVGNTKEDVKEEKPVEPFQVASLPPDPGLVSGGRNKDNQPGEAKRSGAGNLFDKGDISIGGRNSPEAGGRGRGVSGPGQGTKGDGGGGLGPGDGLSAFARPLGGYQVKPRYPDSARRAGVQGTTLLKLRVLENGKVGDIEVEKSAGHRDLDKAAAEAVKKWLFEPARLGREPIAVWVLLPVKFELQ
jgi:protein TonB